MSKTETTRKATRLEQIRAQAVKEKLPAGSVEQAVRTGMRDPSVDVPDPTKVASLNPQFAGVETEADALSRARELGKQVPVPGHALGYVAYPDGETVGPYQPL